MDALILGASGFIGAVAYKKFSLDHKVSGTTYPQDAAGLVRLDVRDKTAVFDLVKKLKPDIVLDFAALPNVEYCETHESESHQTNVLGTRNIAQACAREGARMLFISTDYIFDGEDGPYSEDARPNPLNVYGRHKLAAEDAIRELLDDHIIIRTTVVHGWENPVKNFAARTIDNLRNKKPMKVPADQWGNPTYVENLADILLELAEAGKTGVYNVSGATYCTRVDFALKIAEVFELDCRLITAVDTPSLQQAAKRPLKAGFKINKLQKETKAKALTMREGLSIMRDTEAGLN